MAVEGTWSRRDPNGTLIVVTSVAMIATWLVEMDLAKESPAPAMT
jgi:hypothetical protein